MSFDINIRWACTPHVYVISAYAFSLKNCCHVTTLTKRSFWHLCKLFLHRKVACQFGMWQVQVDTIYFLLSLALFSYPDLYIDNCTFPQILKYSFYAVASKTTVYLCFSHTESQENASSVDLTHTKLNVLENSSSSSLSSPIPTIQNHCISGNDLDSCPAHTHAARKLTWCPDWIQVVVPLSIFLRLLLRHHTKLSVHVSVTAISSPP